MKNRYVKIIFECQKVLKQLPSDPDVGTQANISRLSKAHARCEAAFLDKESLLLSDEGFAALKKKHGQGLGGVFLDFLSAEEPLKTLEGEVSRIRRMQALAAE